MARTYDILMLVKTVAEEYKIKGFTITLQFVSGGLQATLRWPIYYRDYGICWYNLKIPFPDQAIREYGWEEFRDWQLSNIMNCFDRLIRMFFQIQ